MKHTTIISRSFLAGALALLGSTTAQAQIIAGSNDEFIKGDYVEIGISNTGAFGACNVPAGYHDNVIQGCGRTLGFVSDPDKDGWLVSAPGSAQYMGDYFVPGSPYEGWDIQVNGTKSSYRNAASSGTCPGALCTNTVYTTTPTMQTGVWEGTLGNLAITQTTTVRKNKVYFVIYVDIVNTGATTLNNIYYFRGLDPDNDQPWPPGGFPTKNTIVYQPNVTSRNCLVTAEGNGWPKQAYLGLGTKDCRAKCMYFSSWPPSAALNDMYNQTGTASTGAGYTYTVGASVPNNDWGVGVVWNLGNLAPGQKTSLAYTYILKQADLDSALGETSPKFASDGVSYQPYTTFRVCPGKTVALNLINGGQYKWIWTPGTDMSAVGGATKIAAGGTVPTVTGGKIYPDGGVYGDSVEVTVRGPKTYTATGISNCDTQVLIFYVDTISFSTPPSVTSPVRYCEKETATALTAGAATGATLNWYSSPVGGSPLAGAPTPSTIFPAGAPTDFDTSSYWVSQTNVAGCETPRAQIDVIITKKPTPPTTRDTLYCLGTTTAQVTASGATGIIKWYDAATGGTAYPTTPLPANSPAGVTTYFVAQTVNQCESDRTPLAVEISESVAKFLMSKDSLCGTEELTLNNISTNSTASGGTLYYTWSMGDGSAPYTTKDVAYNYTDGRADYTIKLVTSNEHGCMDSTTKQVHVFPQPVMSVAASDTMICQGDAIDFEGTVTSGYKSLLWDFGDSDPAYNTLNVRHAFTKAGKSTVTLTGSYPACPNASASVIVDIIATPNVNLGPDTTFCPGSIALTLKNLSSSLAQKYQWNTGDTTKTLSVTHQGDYWLKATNWQCSGTDSITIEKGCYLDIPNAFTPGSGGETSNNYFLPRQMASRSIATFDMKIFDRWGQLIFESDKVDGRGWDGNYQGKEMPYGVYVYMVKVAFTNGITESYEGNVTLVR